MVFPVPTWAELHELYDSMPSALELDVQPVDIARGKRGDPWSCPLALAAIRQLEPLLPGVRVMVSSSMFIYAQDGKRMGRFWLGAKAARFMNRTDHSKRVKPGTYVAYKPGYIPGER